MSVLSFNYPIRDCEGFFEKYGTDGASQVALANYMRDCLSKLHKQVSSRLLDRVTRGRYVRALQSKHVEQVT